MSTMVLSNLQPSNFTASSHNGLYTQPPLFTYLPTCLPQPRQVQGDSIQDHLQHLFVTSLLFLQSGMLSQSFSFMTFTFYYSIVFQTYKIYPQLLVGIYLTCFNFIAIKKQCCKNSCAIFCAQVQQNPQVPREDLLGCKEHVYIFNLIQFCGTFQNGSTNLYSYQKYVRILMVPHSVIVIAMYGET